jgi:hypothetical protein
MSIIENVAKGSHFEVFSNGAKLYEVEDSTFTEAGKIGLWTKADSVTLFDDLTIKEMLDGASKQVNGPPYVLDIPQAGIYSWPRRQNGKSIRN